MLVLPLNITEAVTGYPPPGVVFGVCLATGWCAAWVWGRI